MKNLNIWSLKLKELSLCCNDYKDEKLDSVLVRIVRFEMRKFYRYWCLVVRVLGGVKRLNVLNWWWYELCPPSFPHPKDPLKFILGEKNLGPWKYRILSSTAAQAPGPESEVPTSTLVLAANRTNRPDILRGFKRYRGGWDIANKHYWALWPAKDGLSRRFNNLCHSVSTGYTKCDLLGIAAFLELSPNLETMILDYLHRTDTDEDNLFQHAQSQMSQVGKFQWNKQ